VRAEVLEVREDDRVVVRLLHGAGSVRRADEVVVAELAVASYSACVGDQVVVLRGEETFVTGVLGEARRRSAGAALGLTVTHADDGTVTLGAAGDLVVAPGGSLIVRADVDIVASAISVRAGRVETEATRIVERAQDTYRYVEGLAELQAGRARTLVEDTCRIVAGQTTIVSEEDTIVDGTRVLLG